MTNIEEIIENIQNEIQIFKNDTNALLQNITDAMIPLWLLWAEAKWDAILNKQAEDLAYQQAKDKKEAELKLVEWYKITDSELNRFADKETLDLHTKRKETEAQAEKLEIIYKTFEMHLNSIKSDRNIFRNIKE